MNVDPNFNDPGASDWELKSSDEESSRSWFVVAAVVIAVIAVGLIVWTNHHAPESRLQQRGQSQVTTNAVWNDNTWTWERKFHERGHVAPMQEYEWPPLPSLPHQGGGQGDTNWYPGDDPVCNPTDHYWCFNTQPSTPR